MPARAGASETIASRSSPLRVAAFRFLALALLGWGTAASAQTGQQSEPAAPYRDGGWFALGVGPSFDHDVSLVMTGNIGRERFVQAGLHNSGNVWGRGGTSAAHVGVGLSGVGRWHRVAIAAGPALVTGQRRVDEAWGSFTTAGLVVNVQAIVTPLEEFGVGLAAFANLNPVKPGVGVALTLVIEGTK